MPSNKIISVLIICVGLISSVWLLNRDKPIKITNAKSYPTVDTTKVEKNFYENNDWKKLLSVANPKTQNIISELSTINNQTEDATNINQLTIDLMSQYLLSKQDGSVSEEEKEKILNNIISTKEYTNLTPPKYITTNIYKIGKNDKDTITKYKKNITLIINTRNSQIKQSPILLLSYIGTEKENDALKAIDHIIKVGKMFISDSLKIEVPSNAVSLHLDLLNSVSTLITNIEAMRNISSDPILGLVGLNDYDNSIEKLEISLAKINNYLSKY